MTYGYRPENWPVFQAELQRRRIAATDILRSGRVESWRQPQETTM